MVAAASTTIQPYPTWDTAVCELMERARQFRGSVCLGAAIAAKGNDESKYIAEYSIKCVYSIYNI